MQKKFLFIFILIALTFAGSDSLFARVTPRKAKKFDAVLTNCSIYQLGTDEIVLRLNGNKLSEPLIQFNNNICYITLYNTLVNKPEKFNAEIHSMTETIPIILDFKVENLSDDLINKAAITITTANPLKLHTLSQIREGFSLRLAAKNNNLEFRTNAHPVKVVTQPKSLLPFNASEKITIELREINLMDVIRMFMTQLGRNVIIDNSFPKDVNITLSLVDVRVDEVLNYLMRTYNIACYSAGANTTVFGTREGLYKLSGADETRKFDISYAKPDAIKTMITSLSGINDSNIVIDERLNALYVKTNPAKMQEITEIINKVDMPGKQVMIRANIFEFTDTATREVANALEVIYNEYTLQWAAGGGIINYDSTVTDMQKIITNSFTNLERKGVGKVLANPSVIALDGQQAEISLTEDYPYISARDQAGNVTWSTENVGPKLTFTPRVGRDGFVNLKLDIETGDVLDTMTSSTGEQMPRTSSRSVKTEIRVREGMPFVVGGLFRENTSRYVIKIPILGDLPLVGDLFRTRSRERNKTQVVIVVTPYILDSK